MKKQLVSILLVLAMLASVLPLQILAAVPQNQRPSNPATNLVIGILNDENADGDGEFPNEPSVTGYDYYYLQSNLSLSTSFWSANFTSNGAGNYINTANFWNDERIVRNAAGNAFGYYNPEGLDLANDPFFQDGLETVINEQTIIENWIARENLSGVSASDYRLLFYVLKYETGSTSGYHLDAKVVKKNNVVLSYDANKPAGVTADIVLPSSHSVPVNTNVTVEELNSRYHLISDGDTSYQFTGWKDASGNSYPAGTTFALAASTVLYAQWKPINKYTVQWLNYNDALLYEQLYDHGDAHDEVNDYSGEAPQRPADSHYTYTFSGWELITGTYNSANGITEDLTYRATYDATAITFTATVQVVLNGTFDTNGNPDSSDPGTLIDIEDVADSDGNLYLKKADGTGEYVLLTKTGTGIYQNDTMANGDYLVYRYDGTAYHQIGTQELTIANADRIRYLPFYSVEYFDGVSAVPIETQYYYIGSSVNVSENVPTQSGYAFVEWQDEQDNSYQPGTPHLSVELTDSIVKAYELTAQWENAKSVKVTVVVNHNGRTHGEIDEELRIQLTRKNSENNYIEVNGAAAAAAYDKADWYDGGTTSGDVTTYEAGIVFTDLDPDYAYGAHAFIEGYHVDTTQGTNGLTITENGDEYEVTVYLIYNPDGYELEFTVEVKDTVADRLVPVAADIQVTRWNGSEWAVIPEHEGQSVEVTIDPATRQGTGKVQVWGFDGSNPYLYRIHVIGVDLGDYQLALSGTDNETYTSLTNAIFPMGAYDAVVTVDADLSEGGLAGAHAVQNGGSLEHHGTILATIDAYPYTISLDPNGGHWNDDSSAPQTIENRFSVPDISGYIPRQDGYTFEGWYLADETTTVAQGDAISDYVSTPGGTLELFAKWKPDITVKGDVVVGINFPCTDDSRTVLVALQMWKEGGSYDVTVATEIVTITPIAGQPYAVGSYEFDNVPAQNHYRVAAIVPVGSGDVLYQNETTVLADGNIYNELNYQATDYEAKDENADNEAIVNLYMKANPFTLGYRVDASAIGEDFRPTDLVLELRHDHWSGSDVSYEIIRNDLTVAPYNLSGISEPISAIDVPRYHANGYLYDYVVSVLHYDITEPSMADDGNGWDNRHYYHDTLTPGYFAAPFSINYTGPASYSAVQNSDGLYQDVTLVAALIPNQYNIHYELNGGTWVDESNIGPAKHTWSLPTNIPDPVRAGYIFTGWTADVAGSFDESADQIKANIWEDVTLTANWTADTWKDSDPDAHNEGDDIPDEQQILVLYYSGNPDYGTVNKDFEVITVSGSGNVDISGVSATPNSADYNFIEWKLDGTTVTVNPDLTYTITGAVGGTVYTFVANFAPVDDWKDDDTGDDITGGDGIPDSRQVKIVYESSNLIFGTADKEFDIISIPASGNVTASATAVANTGYHFTQWNHNGSAVGNTPTLTYEIIGAIGGETYTFVCDFAANSNSGGGGVSKYTLTYETNGGNEIPKGTYSSGTTVQLDAVPEKDGYIFDGWHSDSELKEDVTQVKMTKNITVYAAWILDNGNAGNGHETPKDLNGDDHFAYIQGYPDGTVGPDRSITRAEVATIFFRLLDEDVRKQYLTSENHFVDVTKYDWHNTAISTLTAMDILNGRDDNFFDPNAPITRAEFAVICARFDDSSYQKTKDFSDIFGHWAEEEIAESAAHGWFRGYDDGTFRPDADITRAEAVTMINRVLNRIPETAEDLLADMVIWPDNSDPDIWYYLNIQEATNSHDYVMKNHIYETWTAINENPDWSQYE